MANPCRYAAQIPLPKTAFLPGKARPDPILDARLNDPGIRYFFAVDLYNHGFYWEAHEQLETLWRVSKNRVDYHFLKALIQQAAAGVHWRRGARSSCSSLGWRSLKYLAPVASAHVTYGHLQLFDWIRRWQAFLHTGHPFDHAPPRLFLNLEQEPHLTF